MRSAIQVTCENGELSYLLFSGPVNNIVLSLSRDLQQLFKSGEESDLKEAYLLLNRSCDESVIEDYRDDISFVDGHWETADKEIVNYLDL